MYQAFLPVFLGPLNSLKIFDNSRPKKVRYMIEKVTLGAALSALTQDKPSYIVGTSGSNGVKSGNESVRNFIGLYKYSYDIEPGEELDLGNLGYGFYILCSPDSGEAATYEIASFPVASSNPTKFGDYVSNTNSNIIFGRKESNSNLFLKNNSEKTFGVRITRIMI